MRVCSPPYFEVMATGGRVGFETEAWFNGGLFDDSTALPLEKSDIETVLAASDLDWSEIDPSILGTLFERGLDPGKRAQLGAHYTDRDKIMLLVEPVVIRPLLVEWEAEKTAIAAELERAEAAKSGAARTKRRNEAARRLRAFLERLRRFTVLDPGVRLGELPLLRFQVPTWFGWTSCLAAIACTVRSLRNASSATRFLKSAVNRRRRFVVIPVPPQGPGIHLSRLSERPRPPHPSPCRSVYETRPRRGQAGSATFATGWYTSATRTRTCSFTRAPAARGTRRVLRPLERHLSILRPAGRSSRRNEAVRCTPYAVLVDQYGSHEELVAAVVPGPTGSRVRLARARRLAGVKRLRDACRGRVPSVGHSL